MTKLEKMKAIVQVISTDTIHFNANYKHFHYLGATLSEKIHKSFRCSDKLKTKWNELMRFAILQSIKDELLTADEIKKTFNF